MNPDAESVIRLIESKGISLNDEEENRIRRNKALPGELKKLINNCLATSPNNINLIEQSIKEKINPTQNAAAIARKKEFNKYSENAAEAALAAADAAAQAAEAAKGGRRRTRKSHRKSRKTHRKSHRKTYRRYRK